jgi:hypothetical protein
VNGGAVTTHHAQWPSDERFECVLVASISQSVPLEPEQE